MGASTSIELRDGSSVEIRLAREDDAARIVEHIDVVSGETDFLSFGPGESGLTRELEVEYLRAVPRAGGFLLIGAAGETLAALARIQRSSRPRIAHVGELALTVLRRYWGLGLGRAMLRATLDEARRSGVEKVELRVRADNARARRSYESVGFVVEGTARRSFKVDGREFDEVLMGVQLV